MYQNTVEKIKYTVFRGYFGPLIYIDLRFIVVWITVYVSKITLCREIDK